MIRVQSPPQLAPAASAYKWWVVFLLWLVCFLNYADRQAISSVFPLLEKAFHFDGVQRPDRLRVRLGVRRLSPCLPDCWRIGFPARR